MAAEQGKPNKGGVQGLLFLDFGPVMGKTNSALQEGFIFSFVPLLPCHSFSPLIKPQEPSAPVSLEEWADCAQQIASYFCKCKCVERRLFQQCEWHLPSSVWYTDAPQCKECLQPVLPPADNCTSLLPETARSSWQQEHFQTMCVVLPGPVPSACSLWLLFFLDTFCVCFGSAVQEGKGATHQFVLVHTEDLLKQDTDPSMSDASGRVFKLSHWDNVQVGHV